MPEFTTAPQDVIYEWEVARADAVDKVVFVPSLGLVVRGQESRRLSANASIMLDVLIQERDCPVVIDDLNEAGIVTRGGKNVRKAIDELRDNEITAPHVYKFGENKSAVYAFLENPENQDLLQARMQMMHDLIYGDESDSIEARRSRKRMALVAGAAGTIAAATVGYKLVRGIRKKTHTING